MRKEQVQRVAVIMVGEGYVEGPFEHVLVVGVEREVDQKRSYLAIPYEEATRFSRDVGLTVQDMAWREGRNRPGEN